MLSVILACFAVLVLSSPSKYVPWLPMGYVPLVGFPLFGVASVFALINEKRNPEIKLQTGNLIRRLNTELKKVDRLCELAALHDKIAFWANVAKHRDTAVLHIGKANELREQVMQILEKQREKHYRYLRKNLKKEVLA